MYTSAPQYMPGNAFAHPAQNEDEQHLGLKLYKDDEVFGVDVDETRHMWNILVFKSRVFTTDMGYKDAGVYVAPVLDLKNAFSLGDHFEGFLLSIPFSSWRVFDMYDLERRFMSFHFRPFVGLDSKEINSLCLLISLMEQPIEEGVSPHDDMELIYLCRAFVASINRYYGSQDCSNEIRTTGNRYVDSFLSMVEMYCLREKKLDFYARQLGISTKYLSMTVTKTTGKNASKWISDYVIEAANNLLGSTSSQVNEIAEKLGFASSSDFCKYYRVCTGLTPLQYRREFLRQRILINID